MMSPRIEALLDAPIETLSAEEFNEVVRDRPEEWAYAMSRLKVRMQDPQTPERTAIYLDLMRRYPRSLDHYRERAEDARWRRSDRKWRARNAPTEISAGARR